MLLSYIIDWLIKQHTLKYYYITYISRIKPIMASNWQRDTGSSTDWYVRLSCIEGEHDNQRVDSESNKSHESRFIHCKESTSSEWSLFFDHLKNWINKLEMYFWVNNL